MQKQFFLMFFVLIILSLMWEHVLMNVYMNVFELLKEKHTELLFAWLFFYYVWFDLIFKIKHAHKNK